MSDETVNPTEEIGSDTAKFATVEAPAQEQEEGHEPERRRTFSFGQMLIDAGVLSNEQVAAVQQASQRERLLFGQVLVRDGLMVSRDLATLTALHLGLPLVDLRNETIELVVVGRLPQEIFQRYLVLAMRLTDSRLTVAMTDPFDFQTIQDLTTRTSVYELLQMTEKIKQMFFEGASRDQLWTQALTEGLIPLRRGGMMKVKDGITTPFEVMRVLFSL